MGPNGCVAVPRPPADGKALTIAQFPNHPFQIGAFGTVYVVFPSKYFDEIKRLPESQASSLEFMREMYHATWSGIPRHSDAMMKYVIKHAQ